MYFLENKFFNLSLKGLHYKVFDKYLKNKDFSQIEKHLQVFLDKYLINFFYMPALNRAYTAIKENHYMVLLTSAPSFLAEPIFKMLKFNEYRSSIYKVNKKNKFESISYILDGLGKAEIVSKYKNDEITVYSDSMEDFPLFELATNKVCVNPCKKLKKIAKNLNWEII